MIKPRRGLVLIKRLDVGDEVTKSKIITRLAANRDRINPHIVEAEVLNNNTDYDDFKKGDKVLAKFIALTQIEDGIYVIPPEHIEAVIDA